MHDHPNVADAARDARCARLSLTANPPEHIDGAWWPRSRRLAAELPTLLPTMSDRLGRVVTVGYRHDAWTDTPPQLDVDGRPVDLVGFACAGEACLILIGDQGRHMTLQVVPPDASEQEARQTLDAAHERPDSRAADRRETALAQSVIEVAQKLVRQEGRDGPERTAEIVRWCEEAAEQFTGARVQTFVRVLIEHVVRNRMMESRRANASR